MLDLLPRLDAMRLPSDPVLGETTINVGVLRAGGEANIIPAEAEAEMMIRLVGDKEPVQRAIEAWAAGVADLEYGSHIPPQRFHTLPGFKTAPVAFTTDIPLLSQWGTPLLFGPGSIRDAHTPNERISVSELRESVGTYVRLVRTLLAE
jgi:acetylornithine deacetylase